MQRLAAEVRWNYSVGVHMFPKDVCRIKRARFAVFWGPIMLLMVALRPLKLEVCSAALTPCLYGHNIELREVKTSERTSLHSSNGLAWLIFLASNRTVCLDCFYRSQ